MKILFASMPADGHFNPLTGLAVSLRDRGHDVRWYAGPAYGKKVERLHLPWFPYTRATEIMASNSGELYPERARLKGPKLISFDLEKFFVSQVENHFEDIVELRAKWPFDALLCDGALYAEQLVADKLKVPVYAVGLTSVMPDENSPPPFFGLRPARTPLGKLQHAIVRKLLASAVKTATLEYNELLGSHGLAPIRLDGFPHEPMLRTRRVFLNGSPGLEFPGYEPLANAEYVGPLLPARRVASPEMRLPRAVLDPSVTVVVVSQGTVDNAEPEKLIIPTIEALKDTNSIVVATTGGARTEELRARYTQTNVIVEDFIDYDQLFSHASVFVSSGGFGSSLAAFLRGVPVVGAGTREGKNDLNARVGYNELGIDLRTERPKPTAIQKAVRRIIDTPTYRANVERLRAELLSYDPVARIEAVLLGDPA